MWDAFIVDPMTNALLLLYYFLSNNFVLAIAVFTIIIRLITLPLNLRQQRISMRMQSMQPQIQAIQKKHKDNPAKMQEEFKKIGYNPAEMLGGCLPLLIQFPVLIGLYQAIIKLLGSTPQSLFLLNHRIYDWVLDYVDLAVLLPVDNRFMWLNLAQPDPFYVLPVLVLVTMFLQQKVMMPPQKPKTPGQEENPMAGMSQSMLYTMPIMFGFFSLTFPSGLSIYFVLSNIIGIGQGYITLASMPKPDQTAVPASTTGEDGAAAEASVAAATNGSGDATPYTKSVKASRKSGKKKRRSGRRR
jgi:YidC/Oxa1 family membrane protein insertase